MQNHGSVLQCARMSFLLSVTERSFSTTPGPARHNIYSSQAAKAAPLLLSQFNHSIRLTSLGSHANTRWLVDSKGFDWAVCCCLKHYVSTFSFTICRREALPHGCNEDDEQRWRWKKCTWKQIEQGGGRQALLCSAEWNHGLALWVTMRDIRHIAKSCGGKHNKRVFISCYILELC